MTTTSHPEPAAPKRRTAVRIAALLPGSLAAVLAALVLIVGGALLYSVARQDEKGYLSTGTHGLAAESYAVASDDLDVDLDGADRVLAGDAVRITAKSTTAHPVFVGIARTADVQHYLRGVAHAGIRDVSTRPVRADYEPHPGATRPGLPGDQHFWSVSAGGADAHSVTWPVQDGSWSVVVMNEDGSPGVAADVRVGAKVPELSAIAWITAGAGVLGLVLAAALLAIGVRITRRPPRLRRPTAAQSQTA